MAELFRKGDIFYIRFRQDGRAHKRSLKTKSEEQAQAAKHAVEQTLHRLRVGELTPPADLDVGDWILSGGRLQPAAAANQRQLTLRELLEGFLASPHHAEKAETTRVTDNIHVRHLLANGLANKRLVAVTEADLQHYVDQRKTRGVVGRTIKAELALLRSVWNGYGASNRLVPCEYRAQFPRRVVLPKFSQKPPFMTLDQARKLQDFRSVYLLENEVLELMKLVFNRFQDRRARKLYPWLPYAVVYCLHTSARRSTMMLQRVSDVNFEGKTITMRVRKEDHTFTETRRMVPMLTRLGSALMALKEDHHPGGDFLFCSKPDVPLAKQQAHDGLVYYLRGSKFAGVGWHCFRHSFVSVLAAKGVSMEVICEFTGHHSADVLRLYRHLCPDHLAKQLGSLYSANPAPSKGSMATPANSR